MARRRVALFGDTYPGIDGPTAPFPGFLRAVRERAAGWAGRPAVDFGMVLINEYQSGAPIGWHCDAPQYDVIAGVSLGAPCRMTFRPYRFERPDTGKTARHRTTHEATLMPRSVYLIAGAARSEFEHSIPAVTSLRYSITPGHTGDVHCDASAARARRQRTLYE